MSFPKYSSTSKTSVLAALRSMLAACEAASEADVESLAISAHVYNGAYVDVYDLHRDRVECSTSLPVPLAASAGLRRFNEGLPVPEVVRALEAKE